MSIFEGILLDVYRMERELPPDQFQPYALARLRQVFNVDSAVWGSGHYDGIRMLPAPLALAGNPSEATVDCAAINAQRKIIPFVLANLGCTCAFHAPTLFAAPDERLMREYAS